MAIWVANVLEGEEGIVCLVLYDCVVQNAYWHNERGCPRDIWPIPYLSGETHNMLSLETVGLISSVGQRTKTMVFTLFHFPSRTHYNMRARGCGHSPPAC